MSPRKLEIGSERNPIEALRKTLADREKDQRNCQDRIATCERDLRSVDDRLAAVAAELSDLQKPADDRWGGLELASKTAKIERLGIEQQALETRKTEAQRTISELGREVATIQADVTRIQADVARAETGLAKAPRPKPEQPGTGPGALPLPVPPGPGQTVGLGSGSAPSPGQGRRRERRKAALLTFRRLVVAMVLLVLAAVIVWRLRGKVSVPSVIPAIRSGAVELSVQEPSAALVFLDNGAMPVGTTPMRLDDLKPGNHTIRLTAQQYEPKVLDVRVESGKTVPVTAEMVYLPLTEGIVTGVQGTDIQINLGARDRITPSTRLLVQKSACPIVHAGQVLGYEVSELKVVRLGKENLTARLADATAKLPGAGDKIEIARR